MVSDKLKSLPVLFIVFPALCAIWEEYKVSLRIVVMGFGISNQNLLSNVARLRNMIVSWQRIT